MKACVLMIVDERHFALVFCKSIIIKVCLKTTIAGLPLFLAKLNRFELVIICDCDECNNYIFAFNFTYDYT